MWGECWSSNNTDDMYICPLTVKTGEGSDGVVVAWSAETGASKTLRVPCQTLAVVSASHFRPVWNMEDCIMKYKRRAVWNTAGPQSEIWHINCNSHCTSSQTLLHTTKLQAEIVCRRTRAEEHSTDRRMVTGSSSLLFLDKTLWIPKCSRE